MAEQVNLTGQLKRYFGFDKFKGEQEAIIRNLMSGHDTFVLMPTGGGKSLCYQLPSLIMEGTAIVISPLIALMKNQVDVINGLSEDDGVAHYLNSSLNKSAIEKVKEDILSGKTKLLYVAPESLTKEDNVDFLKTVKISFYAVDEAHCISEWGHDFRPEYRRIRPIINEIGNAPVIALTATATDKVRTDIKKSLGIADAKEFKSSFNRANLYYEVRPKLKDIDRQIIMFIRQHPGKSGIIYCLSRKKVEELAEILKANEIKAAPYHAGLDSATRSQTQDDFLMEKIDVIVATIAFGMGIDKPDVRFVIHYDIPKSLEGYYQETGRAGRDGGEGICIAFYARKDLRKLEKFMENKPVAEQDIGRQLLQETAAYAESSVCRRKMLLHYFGEEYSEENCHNCDNCLHPTTKIEAKDALLVVLQAVAAVKENFRQAREYGFIRGAYHFWSNKSSARSQAYHFLNTVRLEDGDLPPVLDVEHKPADRSVEDFQHDILTWLHIVEDKYHVKPIIYTYYKFKEKYLSKPVFDDYPYWIAHYYVDKVECKGAWKFWQHTDVGRLPGIKSYVDFNIYNGSFYDMKKLTIGNQDNVW